MGRTAPAASGTDDVPGPTRAEVVLEVLVLFAIHVAATHALYRGALISDGVRRWAGDLQIGLYFYLPLIPFLWRGLSIESFGLAPSRLRSGLFWGIVTSVTVLPVGAFAVWTLYRGMGWPIGPKLLPDLGQVAWFHLVHVALPEELFFRGYVQSRLDAVFAPRWRFLGASFGPGLFLAAALFALLHPMLDDFWIPSTWYRLETFFPGLAFGWLRARTGSLAAPVIFHAACNIALFSMQG